MKNNKPWDIVTVFHVLTWIRRNNLQKCGVNYFSVFHHLINYNSQIGPHLQLYHTTDLKVQIRLYTSLVIILVVQFIVNRSSFIQNGENIFYMAKSTTFLCRGLISLFLQLLNMLSFFFVAVLCLFAVKQKYDLCVSFSN